VGLVSLRSAISDADREPSNAGFCKGCATNDAREECPLEWWDLSEVPDAA